jgi:hypothetical protein
LSTWELFSVVFTAVCVFWVATAIIAGVAIGVVDLLGQAHDVIRNRRKR